MMNVSNASNNGESGESGDMEVIPILIIYYIVGTLGIVRNGFICVIIFGFTNMYKNSSNFLVISQSVIDCTACLFMILKALGLQFMPQYFPGIGGQLLCKLWYSDLFVVASAISSTYNSVSLTIDRFIKLHFPLKHKAMISKTIQLCTIVCVVMVSFVYSCGTNVATTVVESDICMPISYWPSYQLQVFGNVTIFIVEFCIPLLVFVICYSSMFKVVRGLKFHDKTTKEKGRKIGPSTHVSGLHSVASTSQINDLAGAGVNKVKNDNDSRLGSTNNCTVYDGTEVTSQKLTDDTPTSNRTTVLTRSTKIDTSQNTLTPIEVSTTHGSNNVIAANQTSVKTYNSWSSAEKNILKTVALINCSFVLCWAPVEIYFFGLNVSMFSPPSMYADILQLILISLVQFNFIVNPIIYSLKLKQIRNGIAKAFRVRHAVEPLFN